MALLTVFLDHKNHLLRWARLQRCGQNFSIHSVSGIDVICSFPAFRGVWSAASAFPSVEPREAHGRCSRQPLGVVREVAVPAGMCEDFQSACPDALFALPHPILLTLSPGPLSIWLLLGLANGKCSLGLEDGGERGRGNIYPFARVASGWLPPVTEVDSSCHSPSPALPSPLLPPGLGW